MTVSGRKSYQSREWKVHQRKRVYERDGYRCRKCGAAGKQIGGRATLSLQHLIAEQVLAMRGRRAEDHELITLCLRCHGRADGGRRYGRRVQP